MIALYCKAHIHSNVHVSMFLLQLGLQCVVTNTVLTRLAFTVFTESCETAQSLGIAINY